MRWTYERLHVAYIRKAAMEFREYHTSLSKRDLI